MFIFFIFLCQLLYKYTEISVDREGVIILNYRQFILKPLHKDRRIFELFIPTVPILFRKKKFCIKRFIYVIAIFQSLF